MYSVCVCMMRMYVWGVECVYGVCVVCVYDMCIYGVCGVFVWCMYLWCVCGVCIYAVYLCVGMMYVYVCMHI